MHVVFVLIPLIATFVGMVGAIFSILGFLRPGRIPRPRRMVNYRVHYDDSLGTSPDITGVAELVVRRKGHDVPAGLLTGDQEQELPTVAGGDAAGGVGVIQATATEGETIQISKGKKALELPKIELKRKDRIRLLVLLSGPRDRLRDAVEGGAYIKGSVRGGGLVREVTPRRVAFYTFGWTGFALLSLVAAILVTFIVRPFSTTAASAMSCVPGTITVAGSTAFAPSVVAVAQRLRQDCPSSMVQVNPGGSTIGSLGAAADLQDSGSSPGITASHLVISDGAVSAAEYPGLVGQPVAVVIFAVVVNRATGVSSLTAQQLTGIWTGTPSRARSGTRRPPSRPTTRHRSTPTSTRSSWTAGTRVPKSSTPGVTPTRSGRSSTCTPTASRRPAAYSRRSSATCPPTPPRACCKATATSPAASRRSAAELRD